MAKANQTNDPLGQKVATERASVPNEMPTLMVTSGEMTASQRLARIVKILETPMETLARMEKTATERAMEKAQARRTKPTR